MKEDRVIKILRILIENQDYITMQALSKKLGVSPKTIQSDLSKLEDWLQGKELKLVRKTGQGILLDGEIKRKLEIRKNIEIERKIESDYTPNSRVNYIAMRLLASSEEVRIYDLADSLFSSRATIQKDLERVGKLLEQYDITLIRQKNRGLRIEGNERKIRSCLLDLLLNSSELKNVVDLITGTATMLDTDRPFQSLEMTIKDANRFINALKSRQSNFIEDLPFQALITIFLMSYISFQRYNEGKFVILSDKFTKSLKDDAFRKEVDYMARVIEDEYGVCLPEMEKSFLQVYFLSQSRYGERHKKDQDEAQELATKLVNYWEKCLGHLLGNKEKLMESLTAHLIPALTRFRHGIYMENPILLEIKEIHKNTFQIVKNSKKIIEDRYKNQVSDDELGFLTLHLAAAIDRMKAPLHILLVSHLGLGVGKLLEERLQRKIPEIKIEKTASYFSVYDQDLENIDLIFTTIELKGITEVPVLHVNPLFESKDTDILRKLVKPFFDRKNDPYRVR